MGQLKLHGEGMNLQKWRMLFVCILFISNPLRAAAPKVVVSIAPIHSLVTEIMQGVGVPELLLRGNASPHHFSLSPSQVQKIVQADLVIWIGEALETFLIKPLQTYHKKNCALVLSEHVMILKPRAAGCAEHFLFHVDPHIWLDVDNAKIIADEIEKNLCELDTENATLYRRNTAALQSKLTQLKTEILRQAHPLKGLQFICFHDAFQYYEHMVGVRNVGVIASAHDLDPSLKQLKCLKDLLSQAKVSCAFSEPQTQSTLLNKLAQEFNIQSGTIDPLGADIEPGIDHYFLLLQKITNAFLTCRQNKHAVEKS